MDSIAAILSLPVPATGNIVLSLASLRLSHRLSAAIQWKQYASAAKVAKFTEPY